MDVAEKDQLTPEAAARHWYYNAKFALLRKHISLLPLDLNRFTSADVGCGIGLFLNKLQTAGLASPDRSIGVDTAHNKPTHAFRSDILIHPSFPVGQKFDFMMLMDVLEHVEDDVHVLRHAVSHIRPGGFAFITVPAIPALTSSHDRFLGHYRRYTLTRLRRTIDAIAGLEPVLMHYYFASLLPVAAPIRLMDRNLQKRTSSDMRQLPASLNSVLLAICKTELLFCLGNRVAGLTAVAVCSVRGH